jgi:hypothetical protein
LFRISPVHRRPDVMNAGHQTPPKVPFRRRLKRSTMAGMGPWILSQHARTVISERRIPLEWIAAALSAPDRVETDPADDQLTHALRRIPAAEHKVLRVVYNGMGPLAVIVTVFFDRRERWHR